MFVCSSVGRALRCPSERSVVQIHPGVPNQKIQDPCRSIAKGLFLFRKSYKSYKSLLLIFCRDLYDLYDNYFNSVIISAIKSLIIFISSSLNFCNTNFPASTSFRRGKSAGILSAISVLMPILIRLKFFVLR